MIHISRIPFSCYGSMLSVSQTRGKNELIIHDVRQRLGRDEAFGLYIVANDFVIDSVSRYSY